MNGVELIQVEMRTECTRRGLTHGGDNGDLSRRLHQSDTQGLFQIDPWRRQRGAENSTAPERYSGRPSSGGTSGEKGSLTMVFQCRKIV